MSQLLVFFFVFKRYEIRSAVDAVDPQSLNYVVNIQYYVNKKITVTIFLNLSLLINYLLRDNALGYSI